VDARGHVLFVTFDGRSEVGSGVALGDLAAHLRGLGCVDGMNLDGGGSTTLWIAERPANGVVSYPSDGGMANHRGERAVANGWFVWAEPYDHPPRFTTSPPERARDGELYQYDADALDLDLAPVVFELADAPAGMTVDPATGVVRWTPGYRDAGAHDVALRVRDAGNTTAQLWRVTVTVLDGDGDGLPDGWETAFGTDPARDDARADPDGDGADNTTEYARGTDPRVADARGDAAVDGAGTADAPARDDVTAADAPNRDARVDAGGASGGPSGCTCAAVGARPRPVSRGAGTLALGGLVAACVRRRARRPAAHASR
jgi:hypothetical protein